MLDFRPRKPPPNRATSVELGTASEKNRNTLFKRGSANICSAIGALARKRIVPTNTLLATLMNRLVVKIWLIHLELSVHRRRGMERVTALGSASKAKITPKANIWIPTLNTP
jgi:hypothetical protein